MKQSSIFSSCASVSESVDLSDEEFKADLLRKKAKKEQKKKQKKDRMAIVSQIIKPQVADNNRSKSEDLSLSDDDENSSGFIENRALTLQNKKTLVDR